MDKLRKEHEELEAKQIKAVEKDQRKLLSKQKYAIRSVGKGYRSQIDVLQGTKVDNFDRMMRTKVKNLKQDKYTGEAAEYYNPQYNVEIYKQRQKEQKDFEELTSVTIKESFKREAQIYLAKEF